MAGCRKTFLWILIVTLVLISLLFISIIIHETNASKNVKNCLKVENDMSISQVIEIMGKPDAEDTYNTRINYKDIDVIRYYYDAPSGSSSGVDIYFKAESLKVVSVVCKESDLW